MFTLCTATLQSDTHTHFDNTMIPVAYSCSHDGSLLQYLLSVSINEVPHLKKLMQTATFIKPLCMLAQLDGP